MKRISTLLVLGLAIATLGSGCATIKERLAKTKSPPPLKQNTAMFVPTAVTDLPPLDPLLLQRPASEYRLGPGDELDLEVVGDVASRARTKVGPDGKIYFYLLPGVDVWGLTLSQARQRLGQEFKTFTREQQPVSITLHSTESQRIWVLGRLNKPGVFPMSGPMTLLEAISEAGGPSAASMATSSAGGLIGSASRGASDDAADFRRAFVMRQGKALRVDFKKLLYQGDMSQNIYLQPDDMVYLPSSTNGSVHVLGAVNTPKAVDYTGRMTLVESLARAGGTAKHAYLSNIAIVRGSLTQPQVAVVDLQAILRGVAPDVELEGQDIVYVPQTPYRTLTRYVDMILDTFARTVGINEGARMVDERAVGVGVNVNVGAGL
jgi:polysaccharide export outer membrane protein